MSAFSDSDSKVTVKLGRGSYIWQALWDQARPFCPTPSEGWSTTAVRCNERASGCRGSALDYVAPVSSRVLVQVVPLTAYIIEVQSAVDSGSGLAGATFFSGSAQKLSAQGIRLSPSGGGTQRGTLVAPPGSYFAALWIGNWIGGSLQVLVPARHALNSIHAKYVSRCTTASTPGCSKL